MAIGTMSDQGIEEASVRRIKRKMLQIATIALVVTVTTWAIYFIYFYVYKGFSFSPEQEVWGQFGDFIGGVLNPILAFLGLIALLLTIIQNQQELSATRDELKQANEHYRQQLQLQRQEERVDDFIKVILYLHGKISDLLKEVEIESFSSNEQWCSANERYRRFIAYQECSYIPNDQEKEWNLKGDLTYPLLVEAARNIVSISNKLQHYNLYAQTSFPVETQQGSPEFEDALSKFVISETIQTDLRGLAYFLFIHGLIREEVFGVFLKGSMGADSIDLID